VPSASDGALAITFLLIVSATIAFVAVCFPVGAFAFGLRSILVWVAGCVGSLTLAAFLGYGITRLLFQRASKPSAPKD